MQFIVNAFTQEEDQLIDTWEMIHPDANCQGDVVLDWEECKEIAKKRDPEEWTVTDIIRLMERKGWTINMTNNVSITY